MHHGGVCGVDIQCESWLAVEREVARFMVWHTIHNIAATPDGPLGLDSSDLAAFLSSGVLPDHELDNVFPFFVGEQAYYMMLDEKPVSTLRPKIRQAVHAYCQTIEGRVLQ